ncbi:MAG: hypothetical protein Q7V12_02170 [Deltaproteobacteria bacterium]|nr:hypothetical protein [Deltaproteobacteria bacterium]
MVKTTFYIPLSTFGGRRWKQFRRHETRVTNHQSPGLSLRYWLTVVSIEPTVRRTWQVR